MLNRIKICILLIIIMITYGICFSSMKTDSLLNVIRPDSEITESLSGDYLLQKEVENVEEISSLSQVTEMLFRESKDYAPIKKVQENHLFDLDGVQPELKYYLVDSLKIMTENSSGVQKSVIQYQYDMDGGKWMSQTTAPI